MWRMSSAVLVSLLVCACGDTPDNPDGALDGGVDASLDGSVSLCARNADCDNGLYCDGIESCEPGAVGVDAHGCRGGAMPCEEGEACLEEPEQCEAADCSNPDADGDGHTALACGGDDCDDSDGNRYPGNAEVCDDARHDEDCDPATVGDRDRDGDGYADQSCCNGDTCGGDCDDAIRGINPDEAELCNAIDDNCDGRVDEAGATCPSGTCMSMRCVSPTWEWVLPVEEQAFWQGSTVDGRGSVYLSATFEGTVDIDADGTDEPSGAYIFSYDVTGRRRWHVAVDGTPVSVLMSADDSSVIVMSTNTLRYLSATDGTEVDTVSVAPFDIWEYVVAVGGARVGDEVVAVFAVGVFDESMVTFASESALLLVRYNSTGEEVARRLIQISGEHVWRAGFDGSSIAGSRRFLGMAVETTAALDFGTGELPPGQYLIVLGQDLETIWATEVDTLSSVAVSDSGEAAITGVFEAPWSPSWTEATYAPFAGGSVPDDAFIATFGSDGEHRWTRVQSGPDRDYFLDAGFDNRGNVLVAGYFSGEMSMAPRGVFGSVDPEPASPNTSCQAFYALLAIEDGDEFVVDVREIGGEYCERVVRVEIDPFGGMLVVGDFNGSVILPSGTSYTDDSFPGRDLFVTRVSELTP